MILVIYPSLKKLHGIIDSINFLLVSLKFVKNTFYSLMIKFLQGASADWWNNMHFQHHSKPNIVDKDPDTRIESLFLLGDTIPIRVGAFPSFS
jgi:hypothetical protein